MNKHGLSLFSFTPWPLVNHAMATVPQLAQYGLTKTAVVTSLVWGNCDGSGKYLHHSGSGLKAEFVLCGVHVGLEHIATLETAVGGGHRPPFRVAGPAAVHHAPTIHNVLNAKGF